MVVLNNHPRVTRTTQITTTTTTTSTATAATTTSPSQPGPELDSVLVLYGDSKALVTNVAGNVIEFDWEIEGEAVSNSYCSLIFNNEMLIYGQILKIEFSVLFVY